MVQIEKNKLLAEYINIDFDKLSFAEKIDWNRDWNNLMKVANKLKEDTEDRNNDYPFSFVKHHLSFDIDDFYNTCLNFIKTMEKYDKQKNKSWRGMNCKHLPDSTKLNKQQKRSKKTL